MPKIKTKIKNAAIVREKHKKIIQAAGKLFAKYGFHKTSMRQIAQASGIELSYLYKYIASKDDVLVLFYDSLFNRYFPIFDLVKEKPDQDPAEQLIEIISTFFKKSQNYYKQTMAAYRETKYLKKAYFKIIQEKEKEYSSEILKLIQRGMASGCFNVKDPLLSANYVAHMLMADVGRGWVYKGRRNKDEVREELIRFILNALGYQKDSNVIDRHK